MECFEVDGQEYTPLTTDQGVLKQVLKEATSRYKIKPGKGSEVVFNYEGRLKDGVIFDSSSGKKPLKILIGEGNIIKGLDIGIMSMYNGETSNFRLLRQYCTKSKALRPKIPPVNSTLYFTIELLEILDP